MPRGPSATSSRGAILAAALELFSSRGYEATTIEDVRDASGASTGSIYHHFGSKQALAAELFLEGLAGYQAEVLDVLGQHTEAEAGVRALVHHYLAWTRKHRTLARFILTTRAPDVREATDPKVQELNQRFWMETRAWRDARIASGQLRNLPADIYRSVVLGPAEAYARRWLTGR
ncbi:MAG: TetR/AcrR family transcriptional regulator, partial [Dehalococcoidia bacterium]